jgi:hypothetical protein
MVDTCRQAAPSAADMVGSSTVSLAVSTRSEQAFCVAGLLRVADDARWGVRHLWLAWSLR